MSTSLHDLREQWLIGRCMQGEITAHSRAALRRRFTALEVVHGDRPVEMLDRATIERWRRAIGHNSPATRASYLSTVRSFSRWLIAEGHLADDPTAHVPPVQKPRTVPRGRSEQDVQDIFARCHSPRSLLIVSLMVGMGLRCVEVSRAEVGDYDRGNGRLLVKGKALNERMLPVPAMVAAAIEAYRDKLGWRSGPLVLSEVGNTGISPTQVSKIVSRIMIEAGVKRAPWDGVSPHALRHTAASDVLDRCDNVRTVQAMLGHTSLNTTQIYLRRASQDQLREAMEGRSYGRPTAAGEGQPQLFQTG